jgi:hypothetical protein
MENPSTGNVSKYFIYFGLVLIFILGLAFIFKDSSSNEVKVVQDPEGFEEGTKLSTYDQVPPNFPKELILEEGITTTHASLLNLPDGRNQIKVSYISGKSLRELADMYKFSLIRNGWNPVVNPGDDVVVISAAREEDKFTATFVRGSGGTSVTFQYEK